VRVQWRLVVIAAAGCGFAAGYIAFDNNFEIRVLRYRLSKAEDRLAQQGAGPKEIVFPKHNGQAVSSIRGPHVPPRVSITDDDMKVALEMNNRARRGEYILKFERPVDRKVMESAISAFAAKLGSNNAPKLGIFLSHLGMAPENVEQLQVHNQKIILASLEAEQAIQQVLLARHDYDKRLKSLLSPEGYSSYRAYEDFQPALREYDSLENFAGQDNLRLDPAYEQQTLTLIQQAQAYTSGWWHGPYDSLPPIGVGEEMISRQLTEEIGQITRAAAQLKQDATAAGLPEQYVSILNRYYSGVIQAKQKAVAQLNRSSQSVGPND
jgi:hypothetical protein